MDEEYNIAMILVTGGAGYIGSHFIRMYMERYPEQHIIVVDNMSLGHREALPQNDRVHLLEENFGNTAAMVSAFQQFPVEAVVHFGALCYVGESQQYPERYFENNVVNSLHLFEAMQTCGVHKILFSSSCATYGHAKAFPITEEHPQEPINVYGLTKLMAEKAIHGYHLSKGWSYIVLRYFNAAGCDESGQIGESHEPETHLIPLILKVASRKRPYVEIMGNDYATPDGTCIRDYIHVNDLALAHCLALEQLQTQHNIAQAINLGTATGASVKEIVHRCEQLTGKPIPVKIGPRRPGDPDKLVANYEKASRILGWKPQRTLNQIIESAWHWETHPRY